LISQEEAQYEVVNIKEARLKVKEAKRNQEEDKNSIFGLYSLTHVKNLGFMQLLQGQRLQVEFGGSKLGGKLKMEPG